MKPRRSSLRSSSRSQRDLDPQQVRYQVLGRTNDGSDLIVQISPAFYEYVRSMSHQGVKPSRDNGDQPRYGKFTHPFHKDPLYTKDRNHEERRGGTLEQGGSRRKVSPRKQQRYDDTMDMDAIDVEMDSEYQMIKEGFAKIDQHKKRKASHRPSKPRKKSD